MLITVHEIDDQADLEGHQELPCELQGALEVQEGVLVDD